jgi:hypothetical protein
MDVTVPREVYDNAVKGNDVYIDGVLMPRMPIMPRLGVVLSSIAEGKDVSAQCDITEQTSPSSQAQQLSFAHALSHPQASPKS